MPARYTLCELNKMLFTIFHVILLSVCTQSSLVLPVARYTLLAAHAIRFRPCVAVAIVLFTSVAGVACVQRNGTNLMQAVCVCVCVNEFRTFR